MFSRPRSAGQRRILPWRLAPLVCGTLFWLPVAPLHADDAEPVPATDQPAEAEQISRWIAELDDNRFDTRENAQLRLEHAGTAALEQVAHAARSSSLESSTRALNILLNWSESEDYALRIAALERIAELPQRPIEAELASEILANARDEAALAKIVELGGQRRIDPLDVRGAIARSGKSYGPVQVIIGSDWKGGIDGLDHLREVSRLTTLSLHSAPLGDEMVPVLLELPQLKRVELLQCELSAEAIRELREKLPARQVALLIRGPAQLGIMGSRTGEAQVMQVVAKSAAAKAGLRQNDTILELDGEKIDDFTELTDRIAVHGPGDSVVMKVRRSKAKVKGENVAQDELELKVTFQPWDERQPPTFLQPAGQQPIQVKVVPPKTIRIERR